MGSRISNILGRLAGRGTEDSPSESAAGTEYKGYTIRPAPRRQGSQWLTSVVIAKTVGEEVKEQHLIRAETHGSKADADAYSIGKAKRIIDEMGDRIFDSR